MAMKSASQVATKWSRNLSAAGESIKQGVQAVTVNPAERAIARKQAYIDGVQRAVAEGKYERGLRRVTLQSWQASMIDKGIGRISAGANAAVPKVQKFMDAWLPHQEALRVKLQSMPRGDIETNKQRCLMAIDHNSSFRMQ